MRAITSLKDPKIQQARELNKPINRLDHCLLEDEQSIEWALLAGVSISTTFVQKGKRPTILEQIDQNTCFELSHGLMQKVVNSKYVGELVCVADIGALSKTPNGKKLIVLERLQDQGNIGSIARSAGAFGFNHIVGVKGECDLFSKKAITASRGMVFHAKHTLFDSNEEMIKSLKSRGYSIVATSSHTDQSLSAFSQKKPDQYAIVMGNETYGVSDSTLNQADELIKIPMHEHVESLNVSAAASIILYELA